MDKIHIKNDERRAFWLLIGLVVLFTLISVGLKFDYLAVSGTYHTIEEESVWSYVDDGKNTEKNYTAFTNDQDISMVTYFPLYVPWEGQYVSLFRLHLETKTKRSHIYSWVIPKIVTTTQVFGKFEQVVDDSGRSDWIGYVRNSPDRRYIIPADNNTPFYRTLSLGILPELGDQIRVYYLEFFFSSKKFFKLAILY